MRNALKKAMSIRRKVLSIAIALAICITLFPVAASAGSMYQISSAADIVTYLCNPIYWDSDNSFIICNDIEISDSDYDVGGLFEGGFTPIGSSTTPFHGIVSGAGYKISNIKINTSDIQNGEASYYGFFGYCSESSIQNLSVQCSLSFPDDFTCADLYIGGIAGFADNCGFASCSSEISLDFTASQTAALTDSLIYVGGITGKVINSQIAECTSDNIFNFNSTLNGNATVNVGAISGVIDQSVINECTTSGSSYIGSGDPSLITTGILTCNLGGIVGACEKTDNNPSQNYISECVSGFDALLIIASSGGTPIYNCGGITGKIDNGTISNCTVNSSIADMLVDGGENACEKYVSLGGIAGNIDSINSVVSISNCKFSNDINNIYYCNSPSTVWAPVSTSMGGIVGSVQGLYPASIENCGFFGNLLSSEDCVSSEYQLIYCGGILGKASTDTCEVTVNGCISNGNQTISGGSTAYIGGISGYIFESDYNIQNCLYSGNLSADGEWLDIYASGIVPYVATDSLASNTGSITGTISAGTVRTEPSNTPSIFTASFAYYLRQTNVNTSYVIASSLTPVVSPSLPNGGNTYTTDVTDVSLENANTQITYSALSQNSFWTWSPLYRLPVFSIVPLTTNETPMYIEPNASTNRISIDRINFLKQVGDIIDLTPYVSSNVPYSIDWLFVDFESSNSLVGSLNQADKTVTLTGGGNTTVSCIYRIYDTNMNDVVTTGTTSDDTYTDWYTEIYVFCNTSPISTVVGSGHFLTSIPDNCDLYLIAQQCSSAFTYLPEMVVNGNSVNYDDSKGVKAITGQTYFVFPLSAGLDNYRYYTVMAGDCVGSGEVDALDVQRASDLSVKAYEYGDSESETAQKLAADINGDGVVDSLDVMIISLSANGQSHIVD